MLLGITMGLSTQALKTDSLDTDPIRIQCGRAWAPHGTQTTCIALLTHCHAAQNALLGSGSRSFGGKVVFESGSPIRIECGSKVPCGEPHGHMTLCAMVASATVERVEWAGLCTLWQMKFQTNFVKWFGLQQQKVHVVTGLIAILSRPLFDFYLPQCTKACSSSSRRGGRCHCSHDLSPQIFRVAYISCIHKCFIMAMCVKLQCMQVRQCVQNLDILNL